MYFTRKSETVQNYASVFRKSLKYPHPRMTVVDSAKKHTKYVHSENISTSRNLIIRVRMLLLLTVCR